ncbi:Rpn family recombination-promoting nuclease/putative transposase, partial [Nitrosomonas europaea]
GSWRTQSRLPSSYVSDDLRERHDDIIWRIRWGKDWLYVYLLLDEGSYHDHELATLRNLTAALFRLENSRTPEDVQQILQALIIWLQSPEQSGLRRTFTIWLKRVFLPGRMPKVRFDEAQDLQEIQNMVLDPVNTN